MKNVITIIEKHFPNCKEASKDSISILEEVRQMCEQNACGQYGKSWTCPPAVDSLDNLKKTLTKFKTFIIVYKVYDLESSFDFEGMLSGVVDFRTSLLNMKKDFHEGFQFLILAAGSCFLCKKCGYLDGVKCKHPDDAFISVEACGIDVMGLMKDNGLKYNNGQNTVTYIGAVLYDS